MKNLIASSGMAFLPYFAAFCGLIASNVHAEGPRTATVATVKNRVLISKGGGKARPAVVKEALRSNTKITTGRNSHVELRFADRSLVRLGSNTTFSFDPKTRKMRLEGGIALIHTPRRQGNSKISTPLATAVIHDDVIAVRSSGKNGVTEFIRLSPESAGGPMTVTDRRTNEVREMGAGQLLRVKPFEPRLRKPVDISVAVFVRTSALFGQKDREVLRPGSPSWSAKAASGNTGSSTSGSGGAQTTNDGTGQSSDGAGTTGGTSSGNDSTDSGTGSDATTDTETSGSSDPDITVETGNTTVTADTPVTEENTANTTIEGSDTSSGNDITLETGATPVTDETTVTADTPVTNEDFVELSVDAESEIIQAETDQISQVEGGVLTVSTEQTQEDTTVSSDATVDSDATLLVQTQNTASSLLSSTTTDSAQATVASETENVIDDVTEEVLCTPTDLVPCPDGM